MQDHRARAGLRLGVVVVSLERREATTMDQGLYVQLPCQGLGAVKGRELHQILQANRLLLFVLRLFHAMVRVRRLMVVEHPAQPDLPQEAWMASIWKLFVVRQLAAHWDVTQITIYQGRYGGRSPKPTSLLIACGPALDLAGHVKEFETSESLPQALKMGWNSEKHEFETAGLKNYPAALCECLAALAERWLKQHFHSPSGLTMVPMDEFIRFSDELVQTFNILSTLW